MNQIAQRSQIGQKVGLEHEKDKRTNDVPIVFFGRQRPLKCVGVGWLKEHETQDKQDFDKIS